MQFENVVKLLSGVSLAEVLFSVLARLHYNVAVSQILDPTSQNSFVTSYS